MVFIDANIFMYAAGKSSPQKEDCKKFLKKLIHSGSITEYFTSSEVLQEILHRYRSIGLSTHAYSLIDYILKLEIIILPVELEDVVLARKFLEDHPKLPTRDGIHAAVAIRKNISKIVSYDRDFDQIPNIKRIIPF